MANIGIAFGSDVINNTVNQLKLTSKHSTLKMYKWGDAQFTTNGSSVGSVTIAHDLDYAPMVVVWRKLTASFSFLAATTYANAYMYEGGYNNYAPTDKNICSIVKASADEIVISNYPAIGSPLSGGNQPNTTYYFRYMIFADLSQAFSSVSNIALTGDRGIKFAKPGVEVLTAEEYQMAYSSKYKAVQYHGNHILSSSLTLPTMWASRHDTEAQEATYVDFNHSLGYAPFFLAYMDGGSGTNWYQLPFAEGYDMSEFTLSGYSEVSAWADSSRIRVTFNRESFWTSSTEAYTFAASTINIKCIIFARSLTETAN